MYKTLFDIYSPSRTMVFSLCKTSLYQIPAKKKTCVKQTNKEKYWWNYYAFMVLVTNTICLMYFQIKQYRHLISLSILLHNAHLNIHNVTKHYLARYFCIITYTDQQRIWILQRKWERYSQRQAIPTIKLGTWLSCLLLQLKNWLL